MAHGQPCAAIFAQGTRTVGRLGVCAFGLRNMAMRGLLHDREPTGSLFFFGARKLGLPPKKRLF